MNLDELKKEAYEDLPITKEEHLDQEAFKNQELKAECQAFNTRRTRIIYCACVTFSIKNLKFNPLL